MLSPLSQLTYLILHGEKRKKKSSSSPKWELGLSLLQGYDSSWSYDDAGLAINRGVDTTKFISGSFNVVVALDFADSIQWVARILLPQKNRAHYG